MSDAARAEWLARAVNGLIRGRRPPQAPPGQDQADLDSLLDTARARLEMSLHAANCGRPYQGAVWQELIRRFNSTTASVEGPPAVEDIAGLRGEIRDRSSRVAEARRRAVWEELTGRVEHKTPEQGVSAFIRRARRSADPPAGTSGRGTPTHALPAAFEQADHGSTTTPRRSRSQSAERPLTNLAEPIKPLRIPPARNQGRQFALLAAGLVLLVAAIAPLPATGISGHPAVKALDSINERIAGGNGTPGSEALDLDRGR